MPQASSCLPRDQRLLRIPRSFLCWALPTPFHGCQSCLGSARTRPGADSLAAQHYTGSASRRGPLECSTSSRSKSSSSPSGSLWQEPSNSLSHLRVPTAAPETVSAGYSFKHKRRRQLATCAAGSNGSSPPENGKRHNAPKQPRKRNFASGLLGEQWDEPD